MPDFPDDVVERADTADRFTCAACGKITDLDQFEEWGGADMCLSCFDDCEQNAATCNHFWEPFNGGDFCGKCATVRERPQVKSP